MTAAVAEALVSAQDPNPPIGDFHNAQSLLLLDGGRPNYPARAIAVVLYAIVLASAVTLSIPHTEATVEEPMELVVVPNPADDTPPPEQTPPPEALDETPPPPEAIEPIAPIEPPKPIQKPAPRVEKVEKKPQPQTARRSDLAPTSGAATTNPNATQSIAANQFLSCMQRAASRAAPDSPIPKHGRVAYRATFGPTGSMTSFNIISSGNPLLDGIASRLGSRCGTLPAIGRAFNISGGVVF